MLAILFVFAATLAYATVDLVRRRRRARVIRAEHARRREAAPVPRALDPPPTWYEGAKLDGGYVVGKLLGSGALGDVHIVENRALGRRWAAKVIRRDVVSDPARRRDLFRELAHGFRVAGHPHIVRTEMFRSFGDEIAVFSELVEGGTLAAALAGPDLAALEPILDIALQLAWALEAIHYAGLVHGDVKPSNILLTCDGSVKLADLGLASLAQTGEGGAAVGTLLYRSPEQAKRRAVTAASDVWSWGVTVISMLLGEAPTHAGGEVAPHTLAALRRRGASVRIVPDDHLYDVLTGCLSRDPGQRSNMTAVVDALSTRLCREGVRPARPVALRVDSRPAIIVDELSAHAEALRQLLADAARGDPVVHDAALCSAVAKAACHRSQGDLAGAATTLEAVLDAAPAATPRLRSGAWLQLGSVHHGRGVPAAAIHAFEQAASTFDDPLTRARAHNGAAICAWTANDRQHARAHAQRAVALAAHALDIIDPTDRADARHVHAASLLTLARILRELGDRASCDACIFHAIAACEALDDAGRQTLIRGLLISGDFAGVRRQLELLDQRARSNRGDTRDPAPFSATALLAATIDLEEAHALADDGQRSAAIAAVRRAHDMLRALAERGVALAALPLAVAQIHLAWLLRAERLRVDAPIDGALATLDDAARTGRRDAAALAQWARAQGLGGSGAAS
ncbi:MAG TPA: protein kinase [Kofleriaceae bacterium]